MGHSRARLRRRDPGHGSLLAGIEVGQPWERPPDDLEIDLRLYELLTGFDHLGQGFADLAETREVWGVCGETFTAEHARRRPGSRPWAWWRFDAPEPRRMLEGSPERISPASEMWRGMPSAHACQYESEAAYLWRLRLCYDGERLPGAVCNLEDATRPNGVPTNVEVRDPGSNPGRPAAEPPDAGTQYALDVVAGEVPACKAIRWACQRHLDDLEEGWRRGFFYDWRAAEYRLSFSRYVRHFQGPSAGEIFRPEPWQFFRTGSIWGWMNADNWRRFSEALTFVVRKIGKTFMVAEDGLFMEIADGEAAPEVWAVATKRDQAAKCIKDAIGICDASPLLGAMTRRADREKIGPKWISCPATKGTFLTKASESSKELGDNVLLGIVDEAAAHPDDSNAQQLRDSMGGRAQRRRGQIGKGGGPLLDVITTAGKSHEGYGGDAYDFAKKILDPEQPDAQQDRFFAFVAELDNRDSWKDPEAWPAAIPNLGIAKSIPDLEDMVDKAKLDRGKVSDLLIFHFNVWAEHAETWLDWESWKTLCQAPDVNAIAWRRQMLEDLRGELCYAGLDLGDRFDMNALALFFPEAQPKPVVLPFYWIPEDTVERVRSEQVQYARWIEAGKIGQGEGYAEAGFLIPTPDSSTNQEWITRDIVGLGVEGEPEPLSVRFEFAGLWYDPWKAKDLVKEIEAAGVECFACRPIESHLAEPSERLEAEVLRGGFDHGGMPVLGWNARNAVAKRTPRGNIMPDKSKATRKRIDGVSATVNAFRGWIDRGGAQGLDVGWYEAETERMRNA